jgi:tetratricopeptide (TPR) repeat protein
MKTQIIFAASFLTILLFFSCKKNGSYSTINTEYDQNIQKGSVSLQNQKLDSAFFYFNQASQAACSDDAKVYALLQLAEIQQQVGDFSGSEETATQAFQNNTSKIYLPYIYNILGIAYLEQNNYQEAINYYDKVLNDSISELEKCIVQNNKAVVYLEQNDFKKAIEIEEKIIHNDSLKKDKKQLAKAIDNLGFTYLKTNNPLALQYLKEAETIRDSINNDFEKIASYIHLSQYYQTTNQPLAANYAQKAYQAASKINSPDDKIEALQYWITNAQPEEAKSLALKQIKLLDSINKVRQSAKNQFAKIKYDASKTLQEKQKVDRQFNIIFIILCMVAVLATAIILFIRRRNKKLLKLSIYTTETRIAKKIHDELANDVFQALTYAETQDLNNPEKKETFLDNLDNIYLRTRNISNINSEIDIGINYQDNLFNMISSFNSNNANVIINASEDLNFYKVKKETKIAIYRVLQELLVNMKKHANSSLVVISLSIRNKSIEIKYSDNGQGFQKATFEKKGLQNVENRIYAIKGTITFDSQPNSGLKINMTLPR